MEKQSISLSYGVLSPTLNKQLTAQGYKFSDKKILQFEKEREAINTLRFGSGLLTDSMVDKIIQKLHNKIVSYVAIANKKAVIGKYSKTTVI